MKKIELYFNNSNKPIATSKCDKEEIIKHDIASLILLHWKDIEDITKLRVKITEVKEVNPWE